MSEKPTDLQMTVATAMAAVFTFMAVYGAMTGSKPWAVATCAASLAVLIMCVIGVTRR